MTPQVTTLAHHFDALEDPRTGNATLHRFHDILTIALCAAIAGADSWTAVARFARAKQRWLEGLLGLPSGVPSHDTFSRLFSLIDAQAFERLFADWTSSACTLTDGEVLALDGKVLRRSHDEQAGRSALTLVSAWASQNRMVLAQTPVEEDSNEITALPRLLDLLCSKGCIVTIDAAGTQTEIAGQIVEAGADYVLALKDNQRLLRQDVSEYFEQACAAGLRQSGAQYHQSVGGGHGRVEVRRCWAFDDVDWLHRSTEWAGLRSFAVVESERHIGERVSTQRRYFISSLPADAARLLSSVRVHWHVENRMHWVLDMAFSEDQSRVRDRQGAQNAALLRRIALNVLSADQAKDSLLGKRQRAGWDEQYLAKLVGFQMR